MDILSIQKGSKGLFHFEEPGQKIKSLSLPEQGKIIRLFEIELNPFQKSIDNEYFKNPGHRVRFLSQIIRSRK